MLLAGEFMRPLRRSMWIGAAVAFASALAMQAWAGSWLPLPGSVAAAAVVAGLLGAGAAALAMPGDDRRAYEAFGWLGRRELDRLRARTGWRPRGRAEDVAQWLAATPRTPANATTRVEMLAVLGRIAEARAEAAELPEPATAIEAVEQAGVRSFVDFVASGDVSLGAMDELLARLPAGSDAARELAVVRAIRLARGRLDRGEAGWQEPLVAVRPSLGRDATWTAIRDTWQRIAVGDAVVGASAVLLAAILRLG